MKYIFGDFVWKTVEHQQQKTKIQMNGINLMHHSAQLTTSLLELLTFVPLPPSINATHVIT